MNSFKIILTIAVMAVPCFSFGNPTMESSTNIGENIYNNLYTIEKYNTTANIRSLLDGFENTRLQDSFSDEDVELIENFRELIDANYRNTVWPYVNQMYDALVSGDSDITSILNISRKADDSENEVLMNAYSETLALLSNSGRDHILKILENRKRLSKTEIQGPPSVVFAASDIKAPPPFSCSPILQWPNENGRGAMGYCISFDGVAWVAGVKWHGKSIMEVADNGRVELVYRARPDSPQDRILTQTFEIRLHPGEVRNTSPVAYWLPGIYCTRWYAPAPNRPHDGHCVSAP